jgi:hypothetical protein
MPPSTSPIDSMVDFSDSHYQYVKQRILAINPTRVFGGIINARDWPPKQAIPEAFYMLTTTLDPVKGHGISSRGHGVGTNSWSAPLYEEAIQWAWQLIGDDISADSASANRSKRYRTNFTMIQEMLQGMYPGFCEKFKYSPDPDNVGALLATPYIPREMVWFPKPRFSDRIEQQTGILFGSAVTTLSSFSPQINS